MTVPATTLSRGDDRPEPRAASAGELLELASSEDFARWEQQLAATGNCANPILQRGPVDAVDRTTPGERASLYDTDSELGGVLRLPCGNPGVLAGVRAGGAVGIDALGCGHGSD